MLKLKKYLPYIFLITLVFASSYIWYVVYKKENNIPLATVAYLDIGQGDSIFIEAPNGHQMLIDGGPDRRVLGKLASVMPWGDKSLDVVLATHTDADHIGGLPDVLENYSVGTMIENGGASDTKIYGRLESDIVKTKTPKIIAHKGMRIMLDSVHNVYVDILFPDRDISHFTEANDGSIVARLVYNREAFMLTGDATVYTENLIMQTEGGESLHSQVLKLGHHGSHTSSSQLWLEKVHPDMAIISAGLNNRYGHPHKEILDRLKTLGIPYRATYKEGTIIYKTDGISLFK
jgi:competence protein ComEC